jgi:hypothetical protein
MRGRAKGSKREVRGKEEEMRVRGGHENSIRGGKEE